MARALPAGDGRGAQRPPAVDEARRPPPGEPRQAPGPVRHQGPLGGRDRSLQSRLAPPRSLARLGARAHATQEEVRAGDPLERQRGPDREHGQVRRAPVGRGPRGRGGASLQTSARVLPNDRGAAGPGARRVHDGRRAQRRPRQGQRGRAADRVRAAAERARTGLEPRRHPGAPVGRRREGLPGPGPAAWLLIRSLHMAKITQSVDLSTRGQVAVLTVDNPPVNALSQHVRKGLHDGIKQAVADSAVQAIVIACAGRTFIAGADITEFGKPPAEPSLHSVLDLIEGSPKPVVAAVHGTALGGGLEVTLACHYRVGVKAARFGLPEVKLGILPGAGGTQRLPRVVGVEKGLSMMVSGDPIGADEALKTGLIDEIVDGDLVEAGVAFAEKVLNEQRPLRKIRDLDDKLAAVRGKPEVFASFRKSIARQTRGFRAPENIVRAVEAAVSLPFDQGLKRERELFAELFSSPESTAQRYFFFAEREAAKIPDVPADTPPRDVKKAAVIGAGTMGGGIAMNFANAGIPVTVIEVAQEALDRGLGIVRKNYEATAARGRLTAADVEKRMGLSTGTTDFKAAADADMVIEAVFEEMPVKKDVFAKLDAICKPDAVLATNTSTLDVDEIASATRRPESVIGTHFFSPANVMRLLENVRGQKSSKATIATAMTIGRRIGKVPVLVGVCYGFVGN